MLISICQHPSYIHLPIDLLWFRWALDFTSQSSKWHGQNFVPVKHRSVTRLLEHERRFWLGLVTQLNEDWHSHDRRWNFILLNDKANIILQISKTHFFPREILTGLNNSDSMSPPVNNQKWNKSSTENPWLSVDCASLSFSSLLSWPSLLSNNIDRWYGVNESKLSSSGISEHFKNGLTAQNDLFFLLSASSNVLTRR